MKGVGQRKAEKDYKFILFLGDEVKMIIEDKWNGLYRKRWNGEIVDEAMSHPAKYARGLIRKIYGHYFKEGWLRAGDCVIDPFGGVALGARHKTGRIERKSFFRRLAEQKGSPRIDWESVLCFERP